MEFSGCICYSWLIVRFKERPMRVWPFSPALSDEINVGVLHWIRDQFANVRMALAIRRSKRIDRFIERSRAGKG